ncbi:MAG: hypothetical protein R6V10_16745 [bacterium]
MDRTRMYGGLICIGTAVFGLLFIIGVFAGGKAGYVALAVPVTLITLTILGLIFWIGYTIWSIKVEPPQDESD